MPWGAEAGSVWSHVSAGVLPVSWCLTLPDDDLISRAVSPHPSNNQTYLRYSEFNHNQRDFQHLGITRKWALIEKPLSFVALTMKTLDFTEHVLGNPWNGTAFSQFPPGTGRRGAPVSVSEERFNILLPIPPLPNHSSDSNVNFHWLRYGDAGEDPDQSQQRSETSAR